VDLGKNFFLDDHGKTFLFLMDQDHLQIQKLGSFLDKFFYLAFRKTELKMD